MRLVQNPICDKLADHRVLCSIAIFFFVAPVVMAIRNSRAEAQHAQARPSAPAAGKASSVTSERSALLGYSASDGMTASSRKLLLELTEEAPAPEPPNTPEEAPGDFFTDLSMAFDQGEASGLVRCRTADEMRIFQLWRSLLNGRGLSQNVTLRRIEQHPDGIEQYQIAIKGTEIQGWITFKEHKNRWYVVGVKQKKREKTEAELDAELDRLLENLKLQGSSEDLRGPRNPLPPKER